MFLKTNLFKQQITDNTNNLIKATILVYSACQKQLLPTSLKPHYTFNYHDITKVIQGILIVIIVIISLRHDAEQCVGDERSARV